MLWNPSGKIIQNEFVSGNNAFDFKNMLHFTDHFTYNFPCQLEIRHCQC